MRRSVNKPNFLGTARQQYQNPGLSRYNSSISPVFWGNFVNQPRISGYHIPLVNSLSILNYLTNRTEISSFQLCCRSNCKRLRFRSSPARKPVSDPSLPITR